MRSGFNYDEYKQWANNLHIATEQFNKWLKTFLLQEAQRVVREAKTMQRNYTYTRADGTSQTGLIDTGAMINSWYIGNQNIKLKSMRGKSKSGKQRVKIDPDNSTVLDIQVIGNHLRVEIGNSMDYASYIEYGHDSFQGAFILTIAINKVQLALPARFNREWLEFLRRRRGYIMVYQIIGETIKSATSIKLGQIFNNPKRYKENITNPVYPNFWIKQINQNITPMGIGTKRIQLDYLMNIQYRIAENTELITNLQQQLDEVGLKLCTEFTELDLELPTKVKNAYYEKEEGILHFFFNITVFAIPETDEDEKMKKLELNEYINKEE